MTYYYKDAAGQEVGPVTEDEIHTFRAGGLLLDETPVRTENSAEWSSYVSKFGSTAAAKAPARRARLTRWHWLTAALLVAILPVYYGIRQPHTVSFGLALDDKPLLPASPVKIGSGKGVPEVTVDGNNFTTGSLISPGRHFLAVELEGAEPIKRHFWVIFGNKDFGVLPLESSKGSLVVSATPSPAVAVVSDGCDFKREGPLPLTIERLPVGDYTIVVRRGDYEERSTVKIQREQRSEAQINLKLGGLELSAKPSDAEFVVSGNGRSWNGKLPGRIEDVPVGAYRLVARRLGWEIESDVSVARGPVTPVVVEFPYGALKVTSDPSGVSLTLNGATAGKTPLDLRELKPGAYELVANDGLNELKTEITVGPRAQANHAFVFRYGNIQVTSTPGGAMVSRNGRELGKTPLTLERVVAGDFDVELSLPGYGGQKGSIRVVEGETAKFATKLFSEKYLQAMKQAREALELSQFSESQKLLASALEFEPDDAAALKLRGEVSEAETKAAEALRIEQANAKMRALAAMPWLDFSKVIADCTDTRQVQYSVDIADGYYQDYIDDKDREKYNQETNEYKKQRYVKRRFVQTGKHTEMRTRQESTFNVSRFDGKYRGRTFRFNCPDKWTVVKVEKDGSLTLKAAGMGSDEIKVTASPGNSRAFSSVQKGQKVAIKGVLTKYDAGGLFTPRSLFLEDAGMLDQ